MIRLAVVVSLDLAVTPVLATSNLTREWAGQFITLFGGKTLEDKAFLDLTQKETELTGTFGTKPDKQRILEKGKIEGNKITFEVQAHPLMRFELMLVEEHLKGEAKGEREGRTIKAILDLQRKTE